VEGETTIDKWVDRAAGRSLPEAAIWVLSVLVGCLVAAFDPISDRENATLQGQNTSARRVRDARVRRLEASRRRTAMLGSRPAFSGFSAADIDAERAFYADVLGVSLTEEMGGLKLELAGGQRVFIYPKPNHVPATFTVLNFQVPDIDATVDELVARGVTFERYEGMNQDNRGVMRDNGPSIAWFKDPAGNILSVIETQGRG
jgi:predicted enzyme related to lactoylglutathione lyase